MVRSPVWPGPRPGHTLECTDRASNPENQPEAERQRDRADGPPRNVRTLTLKDKDSDGPSRFTIRRDADRPLQFDGAERAAVKCPI